MATLLMNLRNVPDDECDEVRTLLNEHRIDYYETRPSRWGLSAACLWLRDERQLDEARRLLDDYQQRRAQRARAEHRQRLESGEADTLVTMFLRNPLRFVLYIAAIIGVLYIAVMPVLLLNR